MKEYKHKRVGTLKKTDYRKCSAIQYKNAEYWVLIPQQEVKYLAQKWDFLKLETFNLVEQGNDLVLLKKEKWFHSTDIIGISPINYKEVKY